MTNLPTYQQPVVLRRHDGTPVDIRQYDDRIVLHDPKRYETRNRGHRSICSNRSCIDAAIIDKRVQYGISGAWRPVCTRHARILTERISPVLAVFLNEMIEAQTQ